jgi:ADP-heptose:LPS heptosyltransferase
MKELVKYIFNQLAVFLVWVVNMIIKTPRGENEILVVKTDNMGDFIIFSPYLFDISKTFNNLFLTLVVSEATEELTRGLMERGYPIKEIIVVDRKKFNKNFFYKLKFLFNIRKKNYKIILSPAYSRESIGDTIVKSAKSEQKVGLKGVNEYMPEKIKKLYNSIYSILFPKIFENPHESEINAYFVAELRNDKVIKIQIPEFILLERDRKESEVLMKKYNLQGRRFIVICPGGGEAIYRRWPVERYARIIDFISSFGFQVVLVGSKKEKELAQKIMVLSNTDIINICGETSIFVLAAVLQKALLYIGNDSGVLHIAAAVKTPTLCIMGGGHFTRFFPYTFSSTQEIVYDSEMKCKNDNWRCARNSQNGTPAPCISNISLEMVKEKIEMMLINR